MCTYYVLIHIYGASHVMLVVKNLPDNAGDMRCGFDLWVRKMPWSRAWQTTCMENAMYRGTWWATVRLVQSWTLLKWFSMHAYIFIHTQKETEIVYDEEVAYIVMKAEKSCDLPYASMRYKKVSGVIQSKSKGLSNKGAHDINPSLRSGESEMFWFSQWDRKCKGKRHVRRGKGLNSSLHLLFCSGLSGLDDAHPLWEGQPTLLNPRIQILTSSRNTSQIHLEQCLSGHSCGSLQLTHYPLLGLIWRPQHWQPQQTNKNLNKSNKESQPQ